MNRSAQFQKSLLAIAIAALSASAWRAEAAPYVQTDLVSDIPIPGVPTIIEPTLVNPWGISHTATSPLLDFGSSTKYDQPLVGDRA